MSDSIKYWKPSKPQRKFKASCKLRFPDTDWSSMTSTQIQTLTGNRSIQQWYTQPEFVEWFLDDNRVMLEEASEAAIKALVRIVEENDVGQGSQYAVSPSQQIAAADKLLSYAGYQPASKREVTYKDADIGKMTEEELREFIKKSMTQLGTTADPH